MATALEPDLNKLCIDIINYRKIIRRHMDMRRYTTALYWAEKVAVLSAHDPKDVFIVAQCLYNLKEYNRAVHTLRLHRYEHLHLPCFNLLLDCLYEAKKYDEAVAIMDKVDVEMLACSMLAPLIETNANDSQSIFIEEQNNKNESLASIFLIKGKIYESYGSVQLAIENYVNALHKSVYCYEALEALTKHEMLTAYEETELMKHLPFAEQVTEGDTQFIKKLYETKFKKYCDFGGYIYDIELSPKHDVFTKIINNLKGKVRDHKTVPIDITKSCAVPQSPANMLFENIRKTPYALEISRRNMSQIINNSSSFRSMTPFITRRVEKDNKHLLNLTICFERLCDSLDVKISEAERCYYNWNHAKCIKLLQEIFEISPYEYSASLVYIACLVQAENHIKLFSFAHELVDNYPNNALSWYAVGCYYDLMKKANNARIYFLKATSLDPLFGPAWIAYGHSMAYANEHDQAMAAYLKAVKTMRGCHLPLMYIGTECGMTNNIELAEKFFNQALSLAPYDVSILQELGIITYYAGDTKNAEQMFSIALSVVKMYAVKTCEPINSYWEPLANNLAHCQRKNKKYEEAIQNHLLALSLRPNSAQTLTSIGFVYALMGELDEAITYLHKSLALNSDCAITTTLLNKILPDLVLEDHVIDEICDEDFISRRALNNIKMSERSKRLGTKLNMTGVDLMISPSSVITMDDIMNDLLSEQSIDIEAPRTSRSKNNLSLSEVTSMYAAVMKENESIVNEDLQTELSLVAKDSLDEEAKILMKTTEELVSMISDETIDLIKSSHPVAAAINYADNLKMYKLQKSLFPISVEDVADDVLPTSSINISSNVNKKDNLKQEKDVSATSAVNISTNVNKIDNFNKNLSENSFAAVAEEQSSIIDEEQLLLDSISSIDNTQNVDSFVSAKSIAAHTPNTVDTLPSAQLSTCLESPIAESTAVCNNISDEDSHIATVLKNGNTTELTFLSFSEECELAASVESSSVVDVDSLIADSVQDVTSEKVEPVQKSADNVAGKFIPIQKSKSESYLYDFYKNKDSVEISLSSCTKKLAELKTMVDILVKSKNNALSDVPTFSKVPSYMQSSTIEVQKFLDNVPFFTTFSTSLQSLISDKAIDTVANQCISVSTNLQSSIADKVMNPVAVKEIDKVSNSLSAVLSIAEKMSIDILNQSMSELAKKEADNTLTFFRQSTTQQTPILAQTVAIATDNIISVETQEEALLANISTNAHTSTVLSELIMTEPNTSVSDTSSAQLSTNQTAESDESLSQKKSKRNSNRKKSTKKTKENLSPKFLKYMR